MSQDLVLQVRDLNVWYRPSGTIGRRKRRQVLHDVSFDLHRGEILGLVGESGSGKTTLARTILGFVPDYTGTVTHFTKRPQMVFQDPYSSLDPRMTVFDLVAEPLREICRGLPRAQARERVLDTMELCGLPAEYADSYPHELDGGRRQRVGLARAMVTEPKFVVCDEPVSALDVSIQAQILNLLMDLQEQRGLAYMFITHDLAVVRHISDEIAVMYMGRIVEQAEKAELFSHPLHPYTQALLSAIPTTDLSRRGRPPPHGGPRAAGPEGRLYPHADAPQEARCLASGPWESSFPHARHRELEAARRVKLHIVYEVCTPLCMDCYKSVRSSCFRR